MPFCSRPYCEDFYKSGEDMKKYFNLILMLCVGMYCLPGLSSAYHSYNYFSASNTDNMCTHCHPGGPHNHIPKCSECHTATAPPYSVDVAPVKANHSNSMLGTSWATLDNWNVDASGNPYPVTCLNCHEPHHNNGITRDGVTDPSYKLVEFTGLCTATGNGETTMSISDLVINNPAWADPAKWGSKTADERGLVVLDVINGTTLWYKVLRASDTSITFKNEHTAFSCGVYATPQYMSLVYGQLIQEKVGHRHGDSVVDATSVKFGGPHDMANDESGTGTDPTPDGICQVCHTQTDHWRSDGTLADHFSGYRCTICHPHDQGFRYVDPGSLCPPDNQETVTVIDQWNVDFQGDAGSTLYGQEGIAHPHGPDGEGIWNIMNLPPLDGNPATVITNPSILLVNNINQPSSVRLTLVGSVGGWSGLPGQHTLIGDYLILLANHYFGYPDSVGLKIEGLDSGATYEVIVRTGEDGTRNLQTTIDLDGDGLLNDETPVTTLGGGKTSSFQCVADATGTIVGTISTATTNEANLGGLILKKLEIVP